jgi:hypothetical protein
VRETADWETPASRATSFDEAYRAIDPCLAWRPAPDPAARREPLDRPAPACIAIHVRHAKKSNKAARVPRETLSRDGVFPGLVSAAAALAARPRRAAPRRPGQSDVQGDRLMMTADELLAHNKNRRIFQIAWVTRDLEKSLKAWVEDLRVGPWRIYRFTDETVKNLHVGGERVTEPFEFRIAISWIGDMEVEIIQPVRGPMIYERFLQERGEGLHHIKEQIADDDMASVVQDYADRGIPVTQTGQFFKHFHFYLDTESRLDFVYELGNCPVQDLPPGTYTVYPPAQG